MMLSTDECWITQEQLDQLNLGNNVVVRYSSPVDLMIGQYNDVDLLIQPPRSGKITKKSQRCELSKSQIIDELELIKTHNKTIAFTNGCFDILHAGHVDFLQKCKTLANTLIVGLNSDASIKQIKGPTRPINPYQHRAAVLMALECVDYVIEFDEPNPENIIREIKPDFLIKGDDWKEKGIVGQEFVESIGGKTITIPLIPGLSTTALLKKLDTGWHGPRGCWD